MRMPFDETGQQQRVAAVLDRHTGLARQSGAERGDPAIDDRRSTIDTSARLPSASRTWVTSEAFVAWRGVVVVMGGGQGE